MSKFSSVPEIFNDEGSPRWPVHGSNPENFGPLIFFGPTDPWEVGPIDLLSFVRPSVRPSVCYQLSSETNPRISLIFCIKLAFSKSKKVTKPDLKKIIWPKFGQFRSKCA